MAQAERAAGWPLGKGEMAGRVRAHDWSATPLGPPSAWPERLRGAVEQALDSPLVTTLAVGAERALIYNDAAARLYGDRHPGALGRPLAETWPVSYPVVAPLYDRAFAGEAGQVLAQPLDVSQAGGEAFDVALTPVRGEGGEVLAVHMTGFEVGARLRAEAALRDSEERQAFLLRLSDALRPLADAVEVQRTASRLLGESLGVDRVAYGEMEPDGETLAVARDWARSGAGSTVGRFRIDDFGGGWTGPIRAGETALIEDAATDPRVGAATYEATWAVAGVRACIACPILKGGRLLAAFFVHQAVARAWSEADRTLVEAVAERTWAAVERARAEAALRASEERLRRVLETDAVGVLFFDHAGTLLEANDAFLAMTGHAPADVAAGRLSWRSLTPPEWVADSERQMAGLARTGRIGPYEKEYLRADGSRRWMLFAGRDLGDGTVVEFCLDVTARREAEAALGASEERLREFGEASSDVLWVRDAETLQWTYLSPAFEAIYGLSREEALEGENFRGWVDLILPEDRGHAVREVARVVEGERVTFEYRVLRPRDGEVRWLRNTDFPIRGEGGRVERIGGVGHDVTEARRAEEVVAQSQAAARLAARRMTSLVEGIPQLVWRAVDRGEWTWASPQWTAFTGQPEGASRGWGWLEALHPDDRAAARAAWARASETGGFYAEHRLREAATGTYRWFQARATPVRDEGGALVEWLGTSTDVQDLREMQDRLRVLVAELQHRTRNLMGVVLGVMRRTRRGEGDPERFAADFQSRLEALARVQGLLSRLDEGGRVTFDELIRAELGALGALDPDGWGAQVTLDGPRGVRLRSSTVQTFALALHELATNAAKYGALSQRQGRLAVRWRRTRLAGGPGLRVDWVESGVAMPDAGAPTQGGGYGRELIERALPYQLGAETGFELGADGVRCTITLPLSSSAEG